MSQPMELIDFGALLNALPTALEETGWHVLNASPHSTLGLVRVAAGQHWDGERFELEERIIMVLDGFATVTVDDWRQTLGSGQTLVIEPGSAVSVTNEMDGDFIAIQTITPPLTPPE
jgi:quercetin dioxygenase-like cupin family protein